MEDLKEKKVTKTKPLSSYDDSELRERVEQLEQRLAVEKERVTKMWGRMGL